MKTEQKKQLLKQLKADAKRPKAGVYTDNTEVIKQLEKEIETMSKPLSVEDIKQQEALCKQHHNCDDCPLKDKRCEDDIEVVRPYAQRIELEKNVLSLAESHIRSLNKELEESKKRISELEAKNAELVDFIEDAEQMAYETDSEVEWWQNNRPTNLTKPVEEHKEGN